jgi:cullin 3
MLYNNVKNITIELLKPIADRILETHDDAFLVELNKTWSDEKMCIIMIKDILLYMNKNYVPKTKLPPVEHMQTSQFKHHVVLHPLIKQRFLNRLMSQIRAERDGGIIEKTQMRATITMLIDMSMGGNNKRIYE